MMILRNLSFVVGYIAAIGVALVGAVVFCGWILGIRGLVSWTGTIDMKTNTAFCFLLLGLSLVFLISEEDNPFQRRAGQLCAVIVLLIGTGTLFEHLTHRNIGIDQIFAQERAGALATESPNRMGPPSSTCFPLAAIALLALSRRNRRLLLTQILAIVICLIVSLPTIGYLYGIEKLYGLAHYTSIAPITALTFVTFGIGLIFSRPNAGLVAQLTADDAGGAIIRRLFLPILFVPLILGFLRVEGERHGLFDAATGTALMMLIMMVSFMALLWFNAHKISYLTAAERAATAAIRSRNQELLIGNEQLRKSQDALRESEERFRASFERGVVPMAITALDAQLLKVNPAFCEMLGYAESELVKKKFTEITHPDDIAVNLAGLQEMINGKRKSFRMEKRYFRKDGSIVWGDMSTAIVRDPSGKPLYIVTHIQDITERKRAEEMLRADEARLKLFIENTPAAVAMLDCDMKYIAVSRRWMTDYHLGEQNIIGRSHYEVFPEIPERWKEIHIRCLAGAVEKSSEDLFLRADGNRDWLKWEIHPWRDAQNEIGGIIMFTEIITERKQMEETLRKSYEQVEEKVHQRTKQLQNAVESLQTEVSERLLAEQALRDSQRELRSMTSKLSLTEERERRRIAMLLHDHIGQLLAVTKIKLGTAQQPGSSEQSTKSLDEIFGLIEEAIKSTRSLTAELSPPSLYTLGLGAAIGEMCEKFTTEHNFVCSFEDDGKIKTLAEDLRSVLFRSGQELLLNIAKHARATAVKISLTKNEKEQIRLKIEDNGIGFEPSELESQPVTKTGFGLMSIRERINHLGGSFILESAKGHGTTVTLTVPLGEKQS